MCFQAVTDTRSDSLALIILMDIKAVKVSGIIDVSKSVITKPSSAMTVKCSVNVQCHRF